MNTITAINASEDGPMGLQPRPPVPFYCQNRQVSQLRFYLSDEIEEPEKYHQMCQVLRQANEGDTVYIHLNSGGGRIDSTVQIIAAMKECRGDVITVADGIVASAATLLFLAGDGYIVNPHCLFMVHNFSGGAYGKGHELEAQISADIRWFNRIAVEYYEAFMTKAEIRKVLKGEDYWFTADEVISRIERRVAFMRSRTQAAQRDESKQRFTHLQRELAPYLDERQVKQMERLIKCAVTKAEASSGSQDEDESAVE